jgi:hypothetical protein
MFVIAYVGNEEVYKNWPHLNRKYDIDRKFTLSDLKLLSSIKETNIQPSVLYKMKVGEESAKLKAMG